MTSPGAVRKEDTSMLSTSFFPSISVTRVVVAFILLLMVSAGVVLPEPVHSLVDPPGTYKDGTKITIVTHQK